MNLRRVNVKRKWKFSRRKLFSARLDFPLALIAAVAVHLLFFGVFKYREPGSGTDSHRAKVTFYNINSLPETKKSAAVKWLTNHDPKLAVRGDSAIGFASYVPHTAVSTISIREFGAEITLPQITQNSYKAIKSSPLPQTNMPLPVPDVRTDARESVVIDGNGRRINLNIPVSGIQRGKTVISLKGSGYYRHAQILEACSPSQDVAAAAAIADSDLESGKIYTVIWGEKQK